MDTTAQILGHFGSAFSIVTLIPQVIKTWKSKSVRDISFATLLIQLIQVVAWLLYGILLKNMPLIIVNLFMFTNTFLLVIMKMKYKTKIEL
ncbi:MAG: hypothetical protein DI598_16985 [Pseudopedobacter saltans]|uniref:MtN3 and saliva related transmembrane protein n=1 Tax=Pseudopedobacter saltans TaxID=151895 RepID=A0A2W5EIL7_9SPHI|nr:MAG: hypothetical protein DI598_16985 [Pseudopedobacter saltans]